MNSDITVASEREHTPRRGGPATGTALEAVARAGTTEDAGVATSAENLP